MPTVIDVTEMERGLLKGKLVQGGLEQMDPLDRKLVIRYDGNVRQMPGFEGNSINMAALSAACPIVKNSWAPGAGRYEATVGSGHPSVVTIDFNRPVTD